MRKRARKESLAGRTPIQALLDQFVVQNVLHHVDRDSCGRVLRLLFVLPPMQQLLSRYPHVLLLDSTYKTNRFDACCFAPRLPLAVSERMAVVVSGRYGMPLLHVVGMTACNMTFSAAFCFLSSETYEDYQWAVTHLKHCMHPFVPAVVVTDRELALMQPLKEVFATTTLLLCAWHIEKNILSKTRGHFDTKDAFDRFMDMWRSVVNSPTEAEAVKAWEVLQLADFISPAVGSYLKTTWFPHRDSFFRAWTDKVTHLGHLVTSRAEGNHASVKSWLLVSTADVQQVTEKLKLAVDEQNQRIRQQEAYDCSHQLVCLSHSLWECVKGRISHFALRKAYEQLLQTQKCGAGQTPCSGVFHKTLGIPCSHTFRALLLEGQPLTTNHFHIQWHIHPLRCGEASAQPRPQSVLSAVLQEIETRCSDALPHEQVMAAV